MKKQTLEEVWEARASEIKSIMEIQGQREKVLDHARLLLQE